MSYALIRVVVFLKTYKTTNRNPSLLYVVMKLLLKKQLVSKILRIFSYTFVSNSLFNYLPIVETKLKRMLPRTLSVGLASLNWYNLSPILNVTVVLS